MKKIVCFLLLMVALILVPMAINAQDPPPNPPPRDCPYIIPTDQIQIAPYQVMNYFLNVTNTTTGVSANYWVSSSVDLNSHTLTRGGSWPVPVRSINHDYFWPVSGKQGGVVYYLITISKANCPTFYETLTVIVGTPERPNPKP